MKIGLVSPYDLSQPGGVQQLTTELAAKLREQGEEVVLVSPGKMKYAAGPGRGPDLCAGGSPHVLEGEQFDRAPNPQSAELGPHQEGVGWRGCHPSPRAGGSLDRLVCHDCFQATGCHISRRSPGWVTPVYRWAPLLGRRMRKAVLTAVSDPAARALPAGWGEPTIIPNAIEVSAYDLPVGRVAGRVAFLGRDEPRKGLDLLLEAWPRIREHYPHAELVVMGVEREQPLPRVRFLGRVSEAEKRRMLASSAVFVAPNTGGESFGIVIAEAMAAGCAVVASDIPAFRMVLGQDGSLVPVGDVPALAEAVGVLVSDDTEASRLGEAAREAVQRFDWSNVLDAYRECYRRAVTI